MKVLAAVALALLVLPACGGGRDTSTAEVLVQLDDRNGSGQEGTATLVGLSTSSVRVTIELAGAPARAQPAAVVAGGCSSFEPSVAFRLEPVVGGRSATELAVPLNELTTGGYGVAVGGTRQEQHVACGDVLP